MSRLSLPLSALKTRYDVIVVGSGYGGGVTASRLSRAGKRVAVLERGREIQTGEFPQKFSELKNEFQVTGKSFRIGSEQAIYDVRLGKDMHVVVGCGLGGGSLVNAGVSLIPDKRVFADDAWPGQVAQDGTIEEGYRRAEQWLRPTSDPRAREMTKYGVLEKASQGLGGAMVTPRIAVSYEDNTNPAGIYQKACTRCGDCCAGCNVGAKNTVGLTYLPDAVRHGAEVFTSLKVDTVRKGTDDLWHVSARAVGPDRGQTTAVTIEAPVVVLAAGTLGSTEILLRSREAGLALSDRLGQRFSANGDIIAFGYGSKTAVNGVGVGHPPKVDGLEIGAAVSGQLDFSDVETLANELHVQEGALPSALASVLPVLFLPNGRLLGALSSLVNGVYKGPFASLQTFFAVSHDSASGRFSLEDNQLALAWTNAKDEPVYARLDAILTKLVTASGGSYVKNPLAGTVMGHQPATAHPLGGCGMGRDRNDGVVDHKCRVFSSAGTGDTAVHQGLYVIDGAVIPRSLGVNPLLTITALAERAMLHFAQDRGLRYTTAPISDETAVPA